MRFKLDENFDLRLVPMVAEGGHDVDTVQGEGLSGSQDDAVYQVCRRTSRTLITLDLDFANPMRFPPTESEGIVVVRPPRPTLPLLRTTLASVMPELRSRPLKGRLWVVEPGRIREYEPEDQGRREVQE